MGFAVLFPHSRGDHTPRLAFPIRKVALVINDDMARFSRGLGADNAFRRNNLSCEGSFVLVDVDWHGRLVPVRASFQKVLFATTGQKLVSNSTGGQDTSSDSSNLLYIICDLHNFFRRFGSFGCDGGRWNDRSGSSDGT